MAENLVSGLSGEIERVSNKAQRWRSDMKEFPQMAAGMSIGLAVIDATLQAAREALATGDPFTMMPAYLALKDYSDDDRAVAWLRAALSRAEAERDERLNDKAMIEAVARAICVGDPDRVTHPPIGESGVVLDVAIPSWWNYADAAKAALAAVSDRLSRASLTKEDQP